MVLDPLLQELFTRHFGITESTPMPAAPKLPLVAETPDHLSRHELGLHIEALKEMKRYAEKAKDVVTSTFMDWAHIDTVNAAWDGVIEAIETCVDQAGFMEQERG